MIVDDDPLVRSGLRLLLGGDAELEIVADAANGRDAIDRHQRDPVDLMLMDLRMPVLDGIEATRELKAGHSAPAVIVLTTFDADDYVVRALSAGAAGFLLKDTPPPQIVAAIEKVVAGEPMPTSIHFSLSPTPAGRVASVVRVPSLALSQ